MKSCARCASLPFPSRRGSTPSHRALDTGYAALVGPLLRVLGTRSEVGTDIGRFSNHATASCNYTFALLVPTATAWQ